MSSPQIYDETATEKLRSSVRLWEPDKILEALEENADPNTLFQNDMTALHIATDFEVCDLIPNGRPIIYLYICALQKPFEIPET